MPLDGELTSILNSTVSWTSWRITLEFLFGASTDLKATDTQQDKNEKVCFALSWCVCYPGSRLKATLGGVLSSRRAPSFILINYSNGCQSSSRTYFEHLFLTCQYLSPLSIYKPLNKLLTPFEVAFPWAQMHTYYKHVHRPPKSQSIVLSGILDSFLTLWSLLWWYPCIVVPHWNVILTHSIKSLFFPLSNIFPGWAL